MSQPENQEYSIRDFLEIKSAFVSSFSPDSASIAVISNLTGADQAYLVSREGGEMRQLTSGKNSVNFAAFSPTKDELIFGMSEGGNENAQLFLLGVPSGDLRQLTGRPECQYRFGGWSRDGRYIAYAANERNGKDFDVFVRDMESGEIRTVFSQGGSCFAGGFSPSGKKLAVMVTHTPTDNDVHLVDLETGDAEHFTAHEGTALHGSPAWMPDERSFYFITDRDRDFSGLARYDVEGKSWKYVMTPDADVMRLSLARDGSLCAVSVNRESYTEFALYDAVSLAPVPHRDFPHGIISGARFSPDGKFLMFNFSDATRNTDAWIWSREENRFSQVTKSPCAVPRETFVEPQAFTYRSFDGLEISAFIFMPRRAAGPVPAIINIHGGPEAQYCPGFSGMFQYFAYRGYAVVAPNVRGSTGYGKKYLSLDDIGLRMDAVRDVAELRAHLALRGDIVPDKMALMGGSYGGYMTLAGLAFFPDLWAAGVSIVGMSNLVTFLENTAPRRRHLREAEYGSLAKDRELLEKLSPISAVDDIKAPIFFAHGANDPRVPVSEARQMHAALAKRGIEGPLAIYDDEGHGIGNLKNRLDLYPKIADFLDAHLR